MAGQLPGQMANRKALLTTFPFMPVYMIVTFFSLQSVPHKELRFILPVTYPLMICWAFCVTKLTSFLPQPIGPTVLKMFVFVVVASDAMQLMREQVAYNLGEKELYTLIKNDPELLVYKNFRLP